MITYQQKIKAITSPSFTQIRNVATQLVTKKYSSSQRDELYDSLNRGLKVIDKEELLWQYLKSFGNKHQEKMNYSLDVFCNSELTQNVFNEEYSVIDWGCGQGLATVCLFDYLQNKRIPINPNNVILIEPSKLALKNAFLHTEIYGVERITPIEKYLNDVNVDDIKTDTPVTIHLFSNILDIKEINLKRLAQAIAHGATGEHFFICLSPLCPNNKRIATFFSYFTNIETIAQYEGSKFGLPKNLNKHPSYSTHSDFTINLLIFKYTGGVSYSTDLETYPPVQFFAAAELDCVRQQRLSTTNSDSETSFKHKAFEVSAPFELSASAYDDINPILAVLSNIITRGLPTRTSPFIEEIFSCYGNSLIESELGEIEYTCDLSQSSQIKKTLYFSPIGIARIQKTVLEALISGVLSLNQKTWTIFAYERDVPCVAMAFADLSNMFSHISSLSVNFQEMKMPHIDLTILCEPEWTLSPLHLQAKVTSSITKQTSDPIYDMVLDIGVLAVSENTSNDFREFKCNNYCYFSIRSCTDTKRDRHIYTSTLIKYRNLGNKNRQGDFEESKAAKNHLSYFLSLLFRKSSFRPGQIPILNHALQQKNVIGLLPTGGGKSLTYQLAGMLQPGVTLIIDPLKALMHDQYEGLLKAGIDTSAFIDSSLSPQEKELREKQMQYSQLQFIFVSPERLCIKKFRDKLRIMHEMNVYFSYGVIDEVHCVSEWGHDFRFSYLHLGRNMYKYLQPKLRRSHVTLFGLTATASFDVLADVERELSDNGAYSLDEETIVRYEDTDRLELQYKIEKVPIEFPLDEEFNSKNSLYRGCPSAVKIDAKYAYNQTANGKMSKLPSLIDAVPSYLNELQSGENLLKINHAFNERHNLESDFCDITIKNNFPLDMFVKREHYEHSGIIFCPHRSSTGVSVSKNTNYLKNKISDIGTFTGTSNIQGRESKEEEQENFRNLDLFRENKLSLMVATKAFGMGIDKPNVRFTINMNYSSSLESFVQEAGRAGRDRKIALALIMFSDFKLLRLNENCIYDQFPLNIIKNKWFNEADFFEILSHYNIVVEKSWIDEFTPKDDLVKIDCEKNKDFQFGKCNESNCSEFKSCQIKDISQSAKNIQNYNVLENLLFQEDKDILRIPSNKLKYLNPDYDRIIYFHNNNFKGKAAEKKSLHNLINKSHVEVRINNQQTILHSDNLLKTVLDCAEGDRVTILLRYRNKEDTHKGIYRLCCIGFIDDYTEDYNTNTLEITLTRQPQGAYFEALKQFLMRYYSENRAKDILKEVKLYRGENEVHKCLGYLTEFVYSKIAVKRKRAIEDMRLFCLLGLDQSKSWKEVNEDLKDFIYYYFNSKYANEDYVADTGESFSLTKDTEKGKLSSYALVLKYMRVIEDDLVGSSGTPIDNLKHLLGAVRLIRRSLTDSNPSLTLLNFFCLVNLGIKDNTALEDELKEDYVQGLVGFAERATSKEGYWEFFKNFHLKLNTLPLRYDFSKLTTCTDEVTARVHFINLKSIKDKYC